MSNTKLPEGGTANTDEDTEEQKNLRYVVLEELEQVMRKHNCGGAIFINSVDSAAWRYVHPEWGGLQPHVSPDGENGHRLRINSKTPEARRLGDATLGYLSSMRDMCGQAFVMYEEIWKMAVAALGGEDKIDTKFHDMSVKPISKPVGSP